MQDWVFKHFLPSRLSSFIHSFIHSTAKQDSKALSPRPLTSAPKTFNSNKALNANNAPKTRNTIFTNMSRLVLNTLKYSDTI